MKFQAGVSGNPGGYKKGRPHKMTQVVRKLVKEGGGKIVASIIEAAKLGDPTARQMFMKYLLPRYRFTPAPVDIEPAKDADEVREQIGRFSMTASALWTSTPCEPWSTPCESSSTGECRIWRLSSATLPPSSTDTTHERRRGARFGQAAAQTGGAAHRRISRRPEQDASERRVATGMSPRKASQPHRFLCDDPEDYVHAAPDETTEQFHQRLREAAIEAGITVVLIGPSAETLAQEARKQHKTATL